MLSKELQDMREEKNLITMAVLRVLELLFSKSHEPDVNELKVEAMPLLPLVAPKLMPEATLDPNASEGVMSPGTEPDELGDTESP
jgi:hypothetical protein